MDIRDITALAVKISGIVLLVIVVSKLPEYFKTYLAQQNHMNPVNIWHYLMPLLIPSVVSVLLITFPSKVSNAVIFDGKAVKSSVDLNGIEIIIIRALGILLLFWAVSDLVFHISNYMRYRSVDQGSFPLVAYNYPVVIATAVEFVFAAWLLMGTNNVVQLLRKIRRQ